MTRFAVLKADIDRELRNLERLLHELKDILVTTTEDSPIRVRAAGSVLHDFYTGVEKIFRAKFAFVWMPWKTGGDMWKNTTTSRKLVERLAHMLREVLGTQNYGVV